VNSLSIHPLGVRISAFGFPSVFGLRISDLHSLPFAGSIKIARTMTISNEQ
jgi:hypothetical protein